MVRQKPTSKLYVVSLGLAVSGCSGPQSALDPAGEGAILLAELFWTMALAGGIIWLVVIALAVFAVRSSPRDREAARVRGLLWAGGLILPTLAIAILLVYSLRLTPALRAVEPDHEMRVSGEQYWWRVRYAMPVDDRAPASAPRGIEAANVLTVPVGRTTKVVLTSPDVIHSFWVPAIAGKLDLIPGRTNELVLRPTKLGRWRGQCAEFCGTSHAFMAFEVNVVSQEEFENWLLVQSAPARDPATPFEERGYRVFFEQGCQACHAIRGTPAKGALGPDLTHFGSRKTIPAGLYPNNIGTIAGWIAGAQDLKPGGKMPSFKTLDGADLRAVSAYLASLE